MTMMSGTNSAQIARKKGVEPTITADNIPVYFKIAGI
jgi:hypothetical protein